MALLASRLWKKRRLILKVGALLVIFLVVLVGAVFVWWTKVLNPRLRRDAEQRWAAIGRQMPESTKALDRVDENESLRALARDLQPFGVSSIYTEGQHYPNKTNIPSEITALFIPRTTSDAVDAAAQESAYLDDHAQDLDRLYKGILQREVPVWSFNPEQGMALDGPNYLTVRTVSLLICADAFHKLEHGDKKGAAEAAIAALRITNNLGEQPTMVSHMMRVSIEGLFASVIARLPEDEDVSQLDAIEVDANRERWRRGLSRGISSLGYRIHQEHQRIYQTASLLQKCQLSLSQLFWDAQWTLLIGEVADQIRASDSVNTSALSDLGKQELLRIALGHRSLLPSYLGDISREGWHRSWVHVNATLLLREQAELIRATRKCVQMGESTDFGDRESIVIPGAKWRIIADTTSNSVSLRLTPLPSWTAEVGESFFLLPLDGSKSWTFRTRPVHSSEASVATK